MKHPSSSIADLLAQRLASIIESSDDAIISKDLDGVVVSWNSGAERIFGYTASEAIGCPIAMLIPDDRPDEEPAILARLRRGERVDHYETVRRRKDGSTIHVSLTVSPISDETGIVIGASKIARDITERKMAEEQQALLLREMSHRVNNLLAVTRSIVLMTARLAATPADMARSIAGRLDALAAAHRLARMDSHESEARQREGVPLDRLIRTILSPYEAIGENDGSVTVELDGPPVFIGTDATSAISLILHELATNAAKYGALSSLGGSLRISWSVENGRLVLGWRERGGPPIAAVPDTQGFGSLLVNGTVTAQLGGALDYDWSPAGLNIKLSVPLRNLAPGDE